MEELHIVKPGRKLQINLSLNFECYVIDLSEKLSFMVPFLGVCSAKLQSEDVAVFFKVSLQILRTRI